MPPHIPYGSNNENVAMNDEHTSFKFGDVITTDVIILESSDDDDAVEKGESVSRPELSAISKLTIKRIKLFLYFIKH